MTYDNACHQMGYAILKEASKPQAKRMTEAIDFMVENATDANWGALQRAVKILQDGYKNKEPNPYTEKLSAWVDKEMKKEFHKDMIYYSLCYEGFRV